MKERNLKGALISVVLVEALGFLSSRLSGDISGLYATLTKPPLAPPGWLFGVAWIILYALMGLAAYLINTSAAEPNDRREALQMFGWQLLVNLMWPVFFFRLELYWAAIVVILILDGLVVLTIRYFKRLDALAAKLMIPYLLWLLFATYLNIGFAILN